MTLTELAVYGIDIPAVDELQDYEPENAELSIVDVEEDQD